MAKFKTSPFYSVHKPEGKINFDHNGEYETNDSDEIALLKALSPRYLTAVEDKAEKPKQTKPAEYKPKKPAAKK